MSDLLLMWAALAPGVDAPDTDKPDTTLLYICGDYLTGYVITNIDLALCVMLGGN